MYKWLKDPSPAGLFFFLALLSLVSAVVVVCITPNGEATTEITHQVAPETTAGWKYLFDYTNAYKLVDDYPTTKMDSEQTIERKRLIGRIAEGIYKVRTRKGNQPYWFCGVPYEGEEAIDLSIEVAWHIVNAAEMASDSVVKINPWGLAGLASNESGLDLCTLGLYPRLAAYDLGILKRRKRTISHTRAEIAAVVIHPEMTRRFRAFDLGMIQTLDSHYRADQQYKKKPVDILTLLDWPGFYWQAEYLHQLAVRYNTDEPWTYWPGYRAEWKATKVRRYARQLGATKLEI